MAGSVEVLAGMAEVLLHRISVEAGELPRSVWPTPVIHRKLYRSVLSIRTGVRIAWHGQASAFRDAAGNDWCAADIEL